MSDNEEKFISCIQFQSFSFSLRGKNVKMLVRNLKKFFQWEPKKENEIHLS